MTIYRVLYGASPEAGTMGLIGFVALMANLASVFILLRWRDGDSNVRSVWLCSRNDAIGNVGVIGAAWPDLVVAALLAGLFLKSATAITAQALGELRTDQATNTHGADAQI